MKGVSVGECEVWELGPRVSWGVGLARLGRGRLKQKKIKMEKVPGLYKTEVSVCEREAKGLDVVTCKARKGDRG